LKIGDLLYLWHVTGNINVSSAYLWHNVL